MANIDYNQGLALAERLTGKKGNDAIRTIQTWNNLSDKSGLYGPETHSVLTKIYNQRMNTPYVMPRGNLRESSVINQYHQPKADALYESTVVGDRSDNARKIVSARTNIPAGNLKYRSETLNQGIRGAIGSVAIAAAGAAIAGIAAGTPVPASVVAPLANNKGSVSTDLVNTVLRHPFKTAGAVAGVASGIRVANMVGAAPTGQTTYYYTPETDEAKRFITKAGIRFGGNIPSNLDVKTKDGEVPLYDYLSDKGSFDYRPTKGSYPYEIAKRTLWQNFFNYGPNNYLRASPSAQKTSNDVFGIAAPDTTGTYNLEQATREAEARALAEARARLSGNPAPKKLPTPAKETAGQDGTQTPATKPADNIDDSWDVNKMIRWDLSTPPDTTGRTGTYLY